MKNTIWVVREPNGPFEQEIHELPSPVAGEVLARIAASGLNPLDLKIRAAKAGHAKQPLTLCLVSTCPEQS